MSRRFQVRLLPTLASTLALGLLLTLGTWQSLRFQEKLADESIRFARADLDIVELHSLQNIHHDLDHRMASVKGRLDPNHNYLIKHRILNGKPGFWLISPLTIEGSQDTILVNRGWLPYPNGRELIATLATPSSNATFTGRLHFPSRVIADKAQRDKNTEQATTISHISNTPPNIKLIELESYDLIAISSALGLPATEHPVVLTLGEGFSGQPYPIASLENVTSIYLTSEKHLGYALTWYILALCLVAMYLAAGFGLLRSERFR